MPPSTPAQLPTQRRYSADILIIGAGILGLLTAKRFAEEGCSVLLIDRQAAGQEASFAGGGILSALKPWQQSSATRNLIHASQALYPALTEALHLDTGIDPEYERSGLMIIDAPPRKTEQAAIPVCAEHQHLSLQEAQPIVPSVRIETHADYFPQVAQIRNPKLLQALKQWVSNHQRITLLEHSEVTDIARQSDRITHVIAGHARCSGSHCVITAGAWSNQLMQPLGQTLPVKPIRGQMLRIRPEQSLFSHILLKEECYLIPRRNGTVLIGSTLEDCGFDKTTTSSAYQTLMTQALSIAPGLRGAKLLDHWAGLRPGTSRDRPIIDRIHSTTNGFLCTGHFRYGLTSAPASASLICDLVIGRHTHSAHVCPEDYWLG